MEVSDKPSNMNCYNLKIFSILIPKGFFFQNQLRGSGHRIAATRMDAKLSISGWISEQMGGIRLHMIYTDLPITQCVLASNILNKICCTAYMIVF